MSITRYYARLIITLYERRETRRRNLRVVKKTDAHRKRTYTHAHRFTPRHGESVCESIALSFIEYSIHLRAAPWQFGIVFTTDPSPTPLPSSSPSHRVSVALDATLSRHYDLSPSAKSARGVIDCAPTSTTGRRGVSGDDSANATTMISRPAIQFLTVPFTVCTHVPSCPPIVIPLPFSPSNARSIDDDDDDHPPTTGTGKRDRGPLRLFRVTWRIRLLDVTFRFLGSANARLALDYAEHPLILSA